MKLARSGSAGTGLDGGDRGHAQQLVDGEQGPDLLFHPRAVAGAQDVAVEQGVPQGEVGGLDLPALVREPDQGVGRVVPVVEQGGDQAVAVAAAAAVRAGHGQVGFDDPHCQPVQAGQVGAVGQVLAYRRVAGGPAPGEQHRPGAVDRGEESVGVEGPVQQDEHPGAQQRQQPPGHRRLVPVGR